MHANYMKKTNQELIAEYFYMVRCKRWYTILHNIPYEDAVHIEIIPNLHLRERNKDRYDKKLKRTIGRRA